MILNKRTLFFLSLIFTSYIAASEPLTVLSWNIDTNIGRTEEGYAREAFPELRVNARIPKIIESLTGLIDQHAPDVIQLQEGRSFTTKYGDCVDSITPLVRFLETKGYAVSATKYNPSDRAFSYIEAIKKANFTPLGIASKYFTKTPDSPTDHTKHAERLEEIKNHNFGEEWERSALISKFSGKDGQEYYLFNVHLGVSLGHRLQACELLKQWVKEIVSQQKNAKVVITGDFNTFADWGGPKQLEIMSTNSPLNETTQSLLMTNGTHATSSFIAFPPDFASDERRLSEEVKNLPNLGATERRAKIASLYAKECKSLGGLLDRVYQSGFKTACSVLIPTPQFKDFDIDSFCEQYVKEFIMRHIDEGPAFASDHQPVLTKLS